MKVIKIIGYLGFIYLCFFGIGLATAQDSTKQVLTKEQQQQQQTQERNRERHNFVDKNGDGFNDNAPDHDGDGIPNAVDPDYKGQNTDGQSEEFVDEDGDGIDDRLVQQGKEKKMQKRLKAGKKAGSQPQDGTGKQQRKGKGR